MSSLFAILHHLGAFALVAALVLELMLVADDPDARNVRRLQLADAVYGASAGIVLIVGLIRVFYFEKGGSYYLHSVPFLAKLALFIVVGLLSIYPTIRFRSWRKALKEGRAPVVDTHELRSVRSIIHWQLVGVVLIIVNAALMARGVGYFG